MTFSHTTLQLFAELLDGLSLPASHPHIEQVARQIRVAREELTEALAEAEPDVSEAVDVVR